MATSYNAIVNINFTNPMDLVTSLRKSYGGFGYQIVLDDAEGTNHYRITFNENLTEEVKALPIFQRAKHYKGRTMHVWINGECACDYAPITPDNRTLLSLGRNGDCVEILRPLVELFGGYIKDEGTSHDAEWERI